MLRGIIETVAIFLLPVWAGVFIIVLGFIVQIVAAAGANTFLLIAAIVAVCVGLRMKEKEHVGDGRVTGYSEGYHREGGQLYYVDASGYVYYAEEGYGD